MKKTDLRMPTGFSYPWCPNSSAVKGRLPTGRKERSGKRPHALALLALPLLMFCFCSELHADNPWGLTFFTGKLTQTHFEEIPFSRPRLEDRAMLAAMLRRELGAVREAISWAPQRLFLDAEGGLVHKWGDWQGRDDSFQEVVASANLRYEWEENPAYLSSVSFGNGLSYTTKKPSYEQEITLNDTTSQLLYYMMVEVAAQVPRQRNWELIVRIHHRSGFYGLFQNVRGGSNYMGLGLRYNFGN